MTGAGPLRVDGVINSAITRAMTDARVPGLSIAATDRGGTLFSGQQGFGDLRAGAPVTADTRFRWFSMTKLVTATAMVRLGDEGRVDLDAPVREHLESWPTSSAATIRQLLTHTAGLSNPLPIRWAHPVGTEGPDQAEMLERLLYRPGAVAHRPGGRARYSNIGYLAAAEIIARTTGMPYTEHVQSSLLGPLKMDATGFDHPEKDSAVGYLNVPRPLVPVMRAMLPSGLLEQRHGSVPAFMPFLVDGAGYGGLIGSASDGARFLRLHLNDGELDGIRFLSVAAARRMRQLDSHGRAFTHATGWFRDRSGATSDDEYWEHYGTGAGYWNIARIYPSRDVGVVIMTNSTRRFDFNSIMAAVTKEHRP